MKELLKNEIYRAVIEGYASGGEGVARIDGRAVFVRGAAAGEICDIRILKSTKSAAWAKLEKLYSPSAHRVTPECRVFGKCGGCDFQFIDYEEELRLKKQRVQDALRRIGGSEVEVEEIIGAENISGYRNKAIYSVAEKDGRPTAGFYRERSHDTVSADYCLIQSETSARAANAVCRWMEKYNVRAYDEKTGGGDIRRVFCRTNAKGQAQIAVVTAKRELSHADALVSSLCDACPEAVSILQNVNGTRGNTVFAGDFFTLYGTDRLTDTLCGMEFSLSPRSFYQVNRKQAEKLYAKALELASLTGTETALDLYCGAGTITLCLSRRAGRVIGAEIVGDAVEDARKNAAANGVENAEFICADASKAASELLSRGLRPDVVTVDPPRKGLAPDVIDAIVQMQPERVVYVSCDPATLARDVKLFSERGYTAARAAAVDMFPRCAHIESVCLLERRDCADKPAGAD